MTIESTFGGQSYNFYVADGSATTFPITFGFLDAAHVTVYVDGVAQTPVTHFNITGTNVVFVAPPVVDADVRIVRVTPRAYDDRLVDFNAFGSITEDQMDLNQRQIWYLIQEAIETDDTGNVNPTAGYLGWDELRSRWSASRDGGDERIGNVADPLEGTDAATKDYVDDIAVWGIAGVPKKWTFTANGSTTDFTLTDVPFAVAEMLVVSVNGVIQTPAADFSVVGGVTDSTLRFLAAPLNGQEISVQNFGTQRFINTLVAPPNSITELAIQPDSISTEKLKDGAVTTLKIADDAVTSDKILDAGIIEGNLANGAVSLAKLKQTGFTTAPGGSYHKFLRVNKDTGNLEVQGVQPTDMSNWLTELGAVSLNQLAAPTTDLSVANKKIVALATPVSNTDAATKAYVDTVGNRSKIELVYDTTLPAAAATWVVWDVSPAWSTDASYVYYTMIINGATSSSGTFNHLLFRAKQGGTYRNCGVSPVIRTRDYRIELPRSTGSTIHVTGWFYQGTTSPNAIATSTTGANGLVEGFQLLSCAVDGSLGGTITAARVLIYGHRGI